MNQKGTDRKKLKPLLRAVLYPLAGVALAAILATIAFDLLGLPGFIEDIVRRKLAEKGLSVSFDNIKAGAVNGLSFENVKFKYKFSGADLRLEARKIRISTDCLPDLDLKLTDVEVMDGSATVETKDEAEESRSIVLGHINASAALSEDLLDIEYLNFMAGKIPFSMSGKIRSFKMRKLSMPGPKAPGKEKPEQPREAKSLELPLAALRKFLEYNDDRSSLDVSFDLDLDKGGMTSVSAEFKSPSIRIPETELRNLELKADVEIENKPGGPRPAFSLKTRAAVSSFCFRDLEFGGADASAKFANSSQNPSRIGFEGLKVQMKDGASIEADGTFDHLSKDFDARFSLDLKSLDPASPLVKSLPLGDIRLAKNANSLSAKGHAKGNPGTPSSVEADTIISASGIIFRNIQILDASTRLSLRNSLLRCQDLLISLDNERKINGDIVYSIPGKALQADFGCSGKLDYLFSPEFLGVGEEEVEFFSSLRFSPKPLESKVLANAFVSFAGDKTFFFGKASLAAANVHFEGMPMDSIFCETIASSDGIVAIPSLKIAQGRNSARMSMLIDDYIRDPGPPPPPEPADKDEAQRHPHMEFSVQSDLEGDNLLRLFLPKAKMEWLDFSGPTCASLKGTIDFQHAGTSSLSGQVSNASLSAAKLKAGNASASISFENEILLLKNIKADFYGGSLSCNITHDFNRETGTVECRLNGAQMHALLNDVRSQNQPKYAGKIALSASSAYRNENSSILLDGNGSMNLTECKVLDIPVLFELVKAVGSKILDREWAEINAISADFKLKGTKVSSDNIETNGNIIALHGYGYYDWNSDYCDFNVRVKPLQQLFPVKILSLVTDRLLSIIEARYVGGKNERRWLPSTGILEK